MRADAVKNRQRILEAAETVFAAEGVSAPIDRVAERAGVGVGTVYRHFPTKEDLFEAIVITRLKDLVALAQAEASAEFPGMALFSYLRRFAHEAAAKHDLFDAMGAAGIDFKTRCAEKVDEMKARDRASSRRGPRSRAPFGTTCPSTSSSAWSWEHVRRPHRPAWTTTPVSAWWESSVTASGGRRRPSLDEGSRSCATLERRVGLRFHAEFMRN